MNKFFYSVDNFNILFKLLEKNIKTKYNQDINNSEYRSKLMSDMNHIYDNHSDSVEKSLEGIKVLNKKIISKFMNEYKNKDSDLNKNTIKSTSIKDLQEQLLKPSNPSFNDNRNLVQKEIINFNKDSDPKLLYKKKLNNTFTDLVSNSNNNLNNNVVLLNKKTNQQLIHNLNGEDGYEYIEEYITIDSRSRDKIQWKNSTRYTIDFAPSPDKWVKYPIYENNPTEPATTSQAINGNRGDANSSGFTFNNKSYSSYDGNKPKGNIIGYESILFKGKKGGNLQNIFKNIKEISLISASLGYERNENTISDNLSNHPYLLLHIPEINGPISNMESEKLYFSKMYTDYEFINYNSASNIFIKNNYIPYKIPTNIKKMYPEHALKTLQGLTLEICNYSGDTIDNGQDVFEIDTWNEDGSNKLYFTLTDTSTYNKYDAIVQRDTTTHIGDTIYIEDVEFDSSFSSTNYTLKELTDILTNKSGIMVEISGDDFYPMYNGSKIDIS